MNRQERIKHQQVYRSWFSWTIIVYTIVASITGVVGVIALFAGTTVEFLGFIVVTQFIYLMIAVASIFYASLRY